MWYAACDRRMPHNACRVYIRIPFKPQQLKLCQLEKDHVFSYSNSPFPTAAGMHGVCLHYRVNFKSFGTVHCTRPCIGHVDVTSYCKIQAEWISITLRVNLLLMNNAHHRGTHFHFASVSNMGGGVLCMQHALDRYFLFSFSKHEIICCGVVQTRDPNSYSVQ